MQRTTVGKRIAAVEMWSHGDLTTLILDTEIPSAGQPTTPREDTRFQETRNAIEAGTKRTGAITTSSAQTQHLFKRNVGSGQMARLSIVHGDVEIGCEARVLAAVAWDGSVTTPLEISPNAASLDRKIVLSMDFAT